MENPENHSTINVEATKPHSQHSVEAMKPQSSEETMKPQHKHSEKELNPAKSGNSQKKQYPSPEEKPDKEGTQTFSNSDSRKEVHPSQSPTTSRYWTTNGDNCPSSGHLDSHCCHCEPLGQHRRQTSCHRRTHSPPCGQHSSLAHLEHREAPMGELYSITHSNLNCQAFRPIRSQAPLQIELTRPTSK